MSKSMNMLRTRRRDNNVKPNRRLDRKSSRGMIYENEELRLKTININAEIERGQSDIKKLRRENEMLKKEIWYLRDEYEKLDKLLKEKEEDFTSSSSTCSSDSEESVSEDLKEVETTQNIENVQKTNLKNLQAEFDHLSVVPEEPSTENSDKSRNSIHDAVPDLEMDGSAEGIVLQPDQGYPGFPMTKHFFAPLPSRPLTPPQVQHFTTFRAAPNQIPSDDHPFGSQSNLIADNPQPGPSQITSHKSLDLLVKTDNRPFLNNASHFGSIGKLDPMQMLEVEHFQAQGYPEVRIFPEVRDLRGINGNGVNGNYAHSFPRSSNGFSNGGNLEELLNDIQTISEDILKISSPGPGLGHSGMHLEEVPNGDPTLGRYPLGRSSFNGNVQSLDRLTQGPELLGSQEVLEPRGSAGSMDKFKSEISVVLMPTPMPLIGFEKYQNLSSDRLNYNLEEGVPEGYANSLEVNSRFSNMGRLELSNSSDGLTSDVDCDHFRRSVDELNKFTEGLRKEQEDAIAAPGSPEGSQTSKDGTKMSIRRKVSIHFKGRRSVKEKKDKDKEKKDQNDEEVKNGIRKLRPPPLTISSTPSSPTPDPIEGHLNGISPQIPTSSNQAQTTSSLPLRADTPSVPGISNPNPQKDSSDSEHPTTNAKHNKSTSASPERQDPNKKHHKPKKKKKSSGMGVYLRNRRNTLSTDQITPHRERSLSICTDRGPYMTDDYQPSSERERTNSLSSCGTNMERNRRKMSTISRIPTGTGGKIPWCACWGNGCL